VGAERVAPVVEAHLAHPRPPKRLLEAPVERRVRERAAELRVAEDEVVVRFVLRGLEVALELTGEVIGERTERTPRTLLGLPNLPRV
jgi:hypothetical protein